jgi:hypothetical protein
MDVRRQNITQAAAGKRSSTITPAYKGPRRLTFRIRRRGFTFEGTPSLLISDRYGVWSVTHRRYIRKTNHHRFLYLKKELDPIIRECKNLVRKVKINQWPEYTQDEELRSLRHKLANFYWAIMPKEVKARIVLFYRNRRQRRLKCFTAAVVLVALLGFALLSLVLIGCYNLRVSLFLGLGYLGVVFLIDKAGVKYGL